MIRRTLAALALGALAALAGCAAQPEAIPGTATPAPLTAPTTTPADDATRRLCYDLDARGGDYYTDVVVPMMAPGPTGRRSITVNIAEVQRAVVQLRQVGDGGELQEASGEVADAAEKMVLAAEAFEVAEGANTTALMTAFVQMSSACLKEGYKPSWFNPAELASS